MPSITLHGKWHGRAVWLKKLNLAESNLTFRWSVFDPVFSQETKSHCHKFVFTLRRKYPPCWIITVGYRSSWKTSQSLLGHEHGTSVSESGMKEGEFGSLRIHTAPSLESALHGSLMTPKSTSHSHFFLLDSEQVPVYFNSKIQKNQMVHFSIAHIFFPPHLF